MICKRILFCYEESTSDRIQDLSLTLDNYILSFDCEYQKITA